MKRVLVVRMSSLGDVLMTIPQLRKIDLAKVELHFLIKEQFKELLELFLPNIRIHCISNHATFSELYKTIRSLQKQRFDVVVDLHRNLRSKIICWMFMFQSQVVRVRKFRLKELLLFFLKRKLFKNLGLSVIDRRKEIAHVLQKANIETKESVVLSNTNEKVTRKNVCIAVDSAWKTKEWDLSRFRELAKEISKNENVILLAKTQYRELDGISKNVMNRTGNTSLKELYEVLSSAKVLICNDAGLMHFAENLDTPVISIFGPTVAELGFSPRLNESKIVESSLWCRPCSKSGKWCHRIVNKQLCLKEVRLEQVSKVVDDFLRNKN